VDEVDFAGFVLARKRNYVRRRVQFDLYKGESQLLAKLTEARVLHIVSFVGSYMIARRPRHEIGHVASRALQPLRVPAESFCYR
jgi:hypothetical protein